ncbi:phosphotransferase [Sphaerisporangium dianthi]|uniref:Phosphotransferase n=1 Tax=Sphaerisporangium dianthi TaxID=1436120 RepID=A0ABV9CQG0_9ACTN
MPRPQWEDLPDTIRDTVQEHCGTVLKSVPVNEGLMPGLTARLHTGAGDRFFLKAVPVESTAAHLYERERWASSILPAALASPRLHWSANTDGWIVMLFDHLEDGREADLSPASPDVPTVLDLVARLGDTLTPCPASDPPLVADNVGFLLAKGRHLLDKPEGVLPHRTLYVRALDGFTVDALAGNTLLHYDLHPGNLHVTRERLFIIDWGFAAAGAAWIDAAMLGPRFIEAGHAPGRVEELLREIPSWRTAPPATVTGLVALWTLFRTYKAMYGPEKDRMFRARAATAGKSWLEHRLTDS